MTSNGRSWILTGVGDDKGGRMQPVEAREGPERLLTMREVATELRGADLRMARRFCRDHSVPMIRVGGAFRVRRVDFERALEVAARLSPA